MKKLFLLSSFFLSTILSAQFSGADALNVSNYLTKEDTSYYLNSSDTTLFKILMHYTPYVGQSGITADDVANAFDSDWKGNPDPNPFIGSSPPSLVIFSGDEKSGEELSASKGTGFLGSLGGLDVTNFADGLAKFLVKRFKQEISADFLDKFKKELTTGKLKEFQPLLPQTYLTLSTLNMFNYTAFLPALREAFYRDFKALNVNLPPFLQTHQAEWFKNKPEIGHALYAGITIYEGLKSGNHPGDMLNGAANHPLIDTLNSDLKSALKLANFVSQSLKSKKGSFWLSDVSLDSLIKKPEHLALYLGLVYQKLKKEDIIVGGQSVKNALKKLGTTLQNLQPYANYIKWTK